MNIYINQKAKIVLIQVRHKILIDQIVTLEIHQWF
jgi:hypothetical protein